jgi:6,7-dimethyl-8-ribityllumazine synthase
MAVLEGKLVVQGGKFALVVGRFNSLVTSQLLEGARDALLRHGAKEQDLTVAWVPGAVEIPQAAKKLAETGRYKAVIALGAVIRGSTSHYDHVCAMAARGIAEAGMSTGVPVVFGVLTTETLEQALERAGTKGGNKGWDAALAAIEMADLLGQIK